MSERNLDWLKEKGFLEAKTVVLHGPGTVLATEKYPEPPWCEFVEYGKSHLLELDDVEDLGKVFGLCLDLSPNERNRSLSFLQDKYSTVQVSRLFVKSTDGVLHLVEILNDGFLSYSLHSGGWDVDFLEGAEQLKKADL